jgi:hypothetical protein
MKPRDSDRLYATVNRYFERMGRTAFPTVRRVSRTLRWSYARVLQAVDDDADRLFTTSYNTVPEPPIGERFVEIY